MPCHLPSHSVSGFAASWRDGDHPEFGAAASIFFRLMDEADDLLTDESDNYAG